MLSAALPSAQAAGDGLHAAITDDAAASRTRARHPLPLSAVIGCGGIRPPWTRRVSGVRQSLSGLLWKQWSGNRTRDTRVNSPMLSQLSYPVASRAGIEPATCVRAAALLTELT